MKETSNECIELDKIKIDDQISSTGEYFSDGVYIKKWKLLNQNGEENTSKYISILEKNGSKYSGTLDHQFQRDGYGLEIYKNGDKYFGQFNSDLRNGNGIYYFSSVKSDENSENVQTECYLGNWKNNVKDKMGIYIWMDQPENNYQYENANFDAYVGEFEDEKYLRGTYLTKINNDFYLYHGNFDKEGKKSDKDSYFYSSKTNKIFHGEINKDLLVCGYMGTFDEDGENVIELVYCILNNDGSVNDIIMEKQLNEEDIEDEKKKMVAFRNIIFDEDYFGKIYNKFSRIKIKIERLGDVVRILEREEYIKEIDKILNKYMKKNIYKNIEENFYEREI